MRSPKIKIYLRRLNCNVIVIVLIPLITRKINTMTKTVLNWSTLPLGMVVILLMVNSAEASPLMNQELNPRSFADQVLTLNQQADYPSLKSLTGCSCAVCVGSTRQDSTLS